MPIKIVKKAVKVTVATADDISYSPLEKAVAAIKVAPKLAPQISDPAKVDKDKYAAPSLLAVCRNLADGDLVAGVFLYRIIGLWRSREKKLERFDRKWLAMSRDDWARSAGLSLSELKNRALPKIKKHCSDFIKIRAMRLTPKGVKLVWISVDPENIAVNITPWDMYEPQVNGIGLFPKAQPYPYKKKVESLD